MDTDPNYELPDDASVAAALGLGGLRVGRHRAPGRVGGMWLDTFWLLHIRPSFDPPGLIGVATSHGDKPRDAASTGWIKAILAANNSMAVHHLESDPLPHLVEHVPMLRASQSGFLDGVGYGLRLQTMEMSTSIQFWNPTYPELVAIERSCWELAETISRQSRDDALTAFVEAWRQYLER